MRRTKAARPRSNSPTSTTCTRRLQRPVRLVLIPSGLVNQLHEPTAFLGARRPDVEELIIPSTWRELGAGVYGTIGPVSYQAYGVNGLNAAGYYGRRGHPRGKTGRFRGPREELGFRGTRRLTGMPGLHRRRVGLHRRRRAGPVHAHRPEDQAPDDRFRRARRLPLARSVAARPLRAHHDRPGGTGQPVEQLPGRRVGRLDRRKAGTSRAASTYFRSAPHPG